MKFLIFTLTLLVAFYVNAQTFIKPDPNIRSYSSASPAFAPAAAATDMCVLVGSATKAIRVTGVEVSTSQGTTGNNEIYLVKRATANTGGTSIAMSTGRWDTGIPAPTATAVYYTANPTVGQVAGNLIIKRALAPVSTAAMNQWFNMIDPMNPLMRTIILRGTAESLAVNFNGQALPSGFVVNCNFFFTEE